MIKVNFDPAKLTGHRKTEWDEWSARARAATEDIIRQWEDWKGTRREWKKKRVGKAPEFKPKFDSSIWTNFRTWLLDHFFHNKCAYCETLVDGYLGDAEHFRPKGQVRNLKDDDTSEVVKIIDEDDEEIDHPGYFWLAYHWQNLLPSCELCNRYSGKLDLFPVGDRHVGVKRLESVEEIDKLIVKMTASLKDNLVYYLEPEDLDRIEGRVLLHPYKDDPEQTLYFKPDGMAAAWEKGDKRAEKSIKVYDLNHPKKAGPRNRAQQEGLKRYYGKLAATKATGNFLDEARKAAAELREEYYEGPFPYAVAIFDYIHLYFGGNDLDPEVLLGPRRVKQGSTAPVPRA